MNLEKLGQIFQGWSNLIFKSKEVEDIALPRIEICSTCPVRTDGFCDPLKGGCGCIIEAKARCIECKCPKGKW